MDDKWKALIGLLWPSVLFFVAWVCAEVYIRELRFSIRALLIVMTVVAAVCGMASVIMRG